MTLRQACCVGALALMSCGGVDLFSDAGTDAGTDAGVTYPFITGTYGVTNAVNAPGTTDQCGLISAYQAAGKAIGVDVTSSVVTFNLKNTPAGTDNPASTFPTATLSGNVIGTPVEANYTQAFGTSCVVRVKRHVQGNVVANNTAALTLTFSVALEAGTCNPADTAYSAIPCNSSYQFTATKQ